MTGTDLCVNKPHKSRSYLNHLVYYLSFCLMEIVYLTGQVSNFSEKIVLGMWAVYWAWNLYKIEMWFGYKLMKIGQTNWSVK
jgi:hypothetical protein